MRDDRLANYPLLHEWFLEHPYAPPNPADQVGVLVWSTCKALSLDDERLLDTWAESLKKFFNDTSTAYRNFVDAENSLAKGGMDFMHVATEVAELAIRMNRGESHYELLATIAERCDIPVFRFLAAWTALNCGKLEDCIEQCESVEDPYGCIYTLLGQAQLELGLAYEAIESLTVAVELTPGECLSLFQLAKAYHVTDQYEFAWSTLERIAQLVPNNTEVAAFFAMIALTENSNKQHLDQAWEYLTASLDPKTVTPFHVGLLMDIAFVSQRDARLSFVIDYAPWEKLRTSKEFMANVPWILKKLESSGWNQLTRSFLERIAA